MIVEILEIKIREEHYFGIYWTHVIDFFFACFLCNPTLLYLQKGTYEIHDDQPRTQRTTLRNNRQALGQTQISHARRDQRLLASRCVDLIVFCLFVRSER